MIGHMTLLALLFVAPPPVETRPIVSPAEFRADL